MKELLILGMSILVAPWCFAEEVDCGRFFNEFPIQESYLFPKTSKKYDVTNNEITKTPDGREVILLDDYQYNRLPVGTVLYDKKGNKVIKQDITRVEQEGYLNLGIDKKYYENHLKLREKRHFSDSKIVSEWRGVEIKIAHTKEGRLQIIKYLESLEHLPWIWFDTETTGVSSLSSQLTEIYASAGKMNFNRKKALVSYKQIEDRHLKIKLNNNSIQKILHDIKNPPGSSGRLTVRQILVMQNYPFVSQSNTLSKDGLTLKELDSQWEKFLESQRTLLEEEEAIEKLYKLFRNYKESVQVAHNLPFDMNMVNGRGLVTKKAYYLGMKNHSTFDTELLVKKYWIPLHEQLAEKGNKASIEIIKNLTKEGKRGPYVSASMGSVTKALNIVNSSWHQADADVEMMIQVFSKIYSDLVKSL